MTNKKIVDRVAYCILLSEVCGICLISEGIEQPKLVQNVLLRLQEDDEKGCGDQTAELLVNNFTNSRLYHNSHHYHNNMGTIRNI